MIVLSGDYHLAWHIRRPRGRGSTSSSPARSTPGCSRTCCPSTCPTWAKHGGFAIIDGPNYGVLEVKQDGSVVARYHDDKGKQKYRTVLTDPAEVPGPNAAKQPSAAPEPTVTGSSSASASTAPRR
ncbi:hypothetical protein OV203_50405 [Nannocystis sp. ILAH1]|uniref:hypothetical protein n=1 Tax=Nannocystis sp. ILAH1 TaxID=2996789 RepID=UPI002271CFF4|nr:hypothetical protein [Nannocystis sp. ILAH1]MCY0995439.1 hypothetical protein [Nannocystis sp. ILAH1]